MKLISDKSQELIKGDNCFDIIRYYLSFIVVFAHFSILSGANNFNWITSSGEAVSGFFILSGFLVYYSFLKKPQLNDYIKKRARRILPPYIFIVFLCFIGGLFLSTMTVSEYFTSPQLYKYIVSNVCFLNFLEPCLPGVFTDNIMPAVNGSLWTMKVEVMLYASDPISFYFFKRWNKKIVLLLIFAISISYRECFEYLYDITNNDFYLILGRQMVSQLVYFYSGTAILMFFDKFQRNIKILLPCALLIYLFKSEFIVFEYLAPFAFAIIIIGIAYNFRYLNFIGKYSNVAYGIYLFHFPVIQTIASLNLTLHAAVVDFLDLDIETVVIDNKNDLAASDAFNLRDGVMTEQTLEPYYQIWSSKFGFQPHQSILDLLFNVGREAVFVLRKG